MDIWILISEVALVLLMTTNGNTANQSCTDADRDETVSCAFDGYFCQWENVRNDHFNWYNAGGYAEAYMGHKEANQYAILKSSPQCPTRNSFFKLSFDYFLGNCYGICELSVIIETQNTGQRMLWSTQYWKPKWNSKEIDGIMSPQAPFQIIFKAKVLKRANWQLYIGIRNIQFQHVSVIATTASPKTAETRATAVKTATTIFPWDATTATRMTKTIHQTATVPGVISLTSSGPTQHFKGATERTANTPITGSNIGNSDFQGGSDEDTDDNKVGIAIGIVVSLLAIGAIVVVVVVVMRRRKGGKRCGFGSLCLLHCLKEKRNCDQSSLAGVRPGVAGAICSHGQRGSTVGETRDINEADGCYSSPDERASTNNLKRKKDNGYDLARVYKPKITGAQDEYNKLSHQPRHTKPAQHQTDQYSLARVDNESCVLPIAVTLDRHVTSGHVIVPSKSDCKTNYVNVNPGNKTPLQTTEAEYNRLDFDRPHETKATSLEETGGHVVYNHLYDENGQYHQLDFDHDHAHNAEVRGHDNTNGHDMYYHLQADA